MSGDMTGVEAAAAATNELKSNGLTLFAVELLDDDDDGGVQFWSILSSVVWAGDKAGGVTVAEGGWIKLEWDWFCRKFGGEFCWDCCCKCVCSNGTCNCKFGNCGIPPTCGMNLWNKFGVAL